MRCLDTVTRLWYIRSTAVARFPTGAAAAFLMSNRIGGDSAQTGDITTGHTAGRDIDIGVSDEVLLKLLQTQIETESKMRILLIDAIDKQHEHLSDEIERIQRELRIISYILVCTGIAILVLLIIIV